MLGSDDTLLVIGGGAAGHACVTTYREAGGSDPVLLISADDRLPYFRPHVSKDYLTDDVGAEDMALSDATWYADRNVDVVLGCEVTAIDVGAGVAATTAGPARWRRTLLATGSDATSLPLAGADDPSISTIRSASDVEVILAGLDGPVVVVGSGFVGCEAAAGLRRRGIDVTVVSEEVRPQHDRLGEHAGRMIEGWLRDVGVRLIGGRSVSRFERHADRIVTSLVDDRMLESHRVIVAVGARPRAEVAATIGLDTGDGVIADETMRTLAPNVFAAGDIAAAWNATAARRLRVEHWGDAETQGQIAGLTLAGELATWTSPPGFWSTIAGETIKHVAWGDGHDEVRVVTSHVGTTIWYGASGVVVGVLTHDHDDDNSIAATALSERWSMPSA